MSEHEQSAPLDTSDTQPQQWGGHPLFPRPETEAGPDRRRFDIIHIIRYKHDGTKEICPKAWRGAELRSWEQVVENYGGGIYQLAAQCDRTYRYQAYTEKTTLPGPSRSFVELGKPTPVIEVSPEPPPPPPAPPANVAPPAPPPAAVAPMPGPQIPGAMPGAAPYPFPYYPPPPPSSGNADTMALVRTLIETSAQNQAAVLQAVLARPAAPAPQDGTNSLQVIREIAPMLQGGGNGTAAFKQGIEVAKEIFRANSVATAPQPAAPAAPPEDDLAILGSILRMIAPAAAPAQQAPAQPAPAPPAPAPPAMVVPPGAAPPGHAWMYSAAGWTLLPSAQLPFPGAAAPAAPAAASGGDADFETKLVSLLADPAKRERLMAALSGAPVPAPPRPAVAPVAAIAPEQKPNAQHPAPVEAQNPPAPAPGGNPPTDATATSRAPAAAPDIASTLADPEAARMLAGIMAMVERAGA
jgi:hypothetical protein